MLRLKRSIHMSDTLESVTRGEADRARKILLMNLVGYMLVSIAELLVGTRDHSVALIADGENNFTGIISVISLIIGLTFSKRPSDEYHLEGHWQFENLAVFVAGVTMFLVGLQCSWNGLNKLWRLIIDGQKTSLQFGAAYMAAASGGTMLLLGILNFMTSRKIQSMSLSASARDLFSDALTSGGTMLAIMGASLFHIYWIDAIAALFLGLFIIYNGSRILSDSAAKLSNGFSPKIRSKIIEFIGKVHNVEEVSFVDVRYSGSNMIVEAEVEVRQGDTVVESYEICKSIEHLLQGNFPILYCCIQVKPGKS